MLLLSAGTAFPDVLCLNNWPVTNGLGGGGLFCKAQDKSPVEVCALSGDAPLKPLGEGCSLVVQCSEPPRGLAVVVRVLKGVVYSEQCIQCYRG